VFDTNLSGRRPSSRLLAIAGGAAVLTFLLAACAPNSDTTPPPSNSPISEPREVAPTSIETEAPNLSEAYNYNIDKSTVDALIDGGQEALLAQPIETRVDIALYFAQEELVKFAELFHSVSKDANEVLPVNGMSAESSVQDVNAFSFHMSNIAVTREMPNGYNIDAVTGRAIAASLSIGAPASVEYINTVTYIDAFEAQQQTADATSVNSPRSLALGGRQIPIIVEGTVTSGTDAANRPFYTYDIQNPKDLSQIRTITVRWIISTSSRSGIWTSD